LKSFVILLSPFDLYLKEEKEVTRVFTKEGIPEIMTIQNCGGKAKPYQIRQFCKIVEQYHLLEYYEE